MNINKILLSRLGEIIQPNRLSYFSVACYHTLDSFESEYVSIQFWISGEMNEL